MNICFLMYSWEKVVPESDTTLRIIHECVRRGHRVAITHPNNLTIRHSATHAFCKIIQPQEKDTRDTERFFRKIEFKEQMLPLSGFDAIFMRVNPPLDPIMLNFMDSVKNDTFILNTVDGLRRASNKLYTAAFHESCREFIPVTHVSKNKDYLRRIIEESDQERMILKPLDGLAGRGVIVIEKHARQNVKSLLHFYVDGTAGSSGSNYVILQEYIEGAEAGDVRILMLNGEAIGAMRRVPAEGDFRSNIHAGGQAVKHVLTPEERRLCRKIGPKLVADGLYFVGLDVVNGKLLEVNVCSPGGITRINRLNRVRLQELVVDFIEDEVAQRESAAQRKSRLRAEVAQA
ncbi:MAG: glutathione synthase [bacterium]